MLRWFRSVLLIASALLLVARPAPGMETERDQQRGRGALTAAVSEALRISSPAFGAGAAIPRRYSGEGEDLSPPLSWSDPPEGTRSFALVCDDPDAPSSRPWVHWVAYAIPASARGLPEAATEGLVHGRNDFGRRAYGGPMPPPGHGVHHYRFRLYALDGEIAAGPGLSKAELLCAMEGKVLAEATLVGTYERP